MVTARVIGVHWVQASNGKLELQPIVDSPKIVIPQPVFTGLERNDPAFPKIRADLEKHWIGAELK